MISDKVDLSTGNTTRGKQRYCIMIDRSIHQEDIIILKVYAPNKKAFEIHEKKIYRTALLY